MQVSYAKHSIGNAPKVSKYKGLVKVRSKKLDFLSSSSVMYVIQEVLQSQPLIAFPRISENFPDQNIKFIQDRFEFNSKLKDHFLNKLSITPTCNRLLCPTCHLSLTSTSLYSYLILI